MINWYRLPHKTALGLILIISRSSTVIKLTAGKLVHLSIATFGDVSISAMSRYTFLQTWYNRYNWIISGDEDIHDIFKHASDYDYVDNYIILYKILAGSLVAIIISYCI